MPNILVSTACLYFWHPERYEQALDERIALCLEAGADGVEISNGPSILHWQPTAQTRKLLRNKLVTVHAELYPEHYSLIEYLQAIQRLPFNISNITFHPDELALVDLETLAHCQLPVALENMDVTRSNWHTQAEFEPWCNQGIALTYDLAHGEETNTPISEFKDLLIRELHLSHSGIVFPTTRVYQTLPIDPLAVRHTLLHLNPDKVQIPDYELVTIEGLLPPQQIEFLEAEIDFIKSISEGIENAT